ncbi:MAG: DUF2971 domain-containing protein [Bacteroidaceae bacterium]|nr:DUF2971 domain-containing protein [Bacteroidaceae bacterium]
MSAEFSPNYMTYNGSLLFHYTRFESALKIISTKKLLFGDFSKMNDISESSREVYNELAEEELKKYKSLSFTFDTKGKRAFEIDSLWGYYGEKGNGACLVFEKNKIFKEFNHFDDFHKRGKIQYLRNFTNALFLSAKTRGEAVKEIETKYKDIFFTKSLDWTKENEYRLLTKNETLTLPFLNIEDALVAVILCLPLQNKVKDSYEYNLLKKLTGVPILHYHTSLGNKTLTDIASDEELWPLPDVDYQFAF